VRTFFSEAIVARALRKNQSEEAQRKADIQRFLARPPPAGRGGRRPPPKQLGEEIEAEEIDHYSGRSSEAKTLD
jgi:hypothetical protein